MLRSIRGRRGSLAQRERDLFAAWAELRTLHKSELSAAVRRYTGTAAKMRSCDMTWVDSFGTHLRDPDEGCDALVVRLDMPL